MIITRAQNRRLSVAAASRRGLQLSVAVLWIASTALGQQAGAGAGGATGGTPPPAPPNTGGGGGAGGNNGGPGGPINTPRPSQGNTPQINRPIFISGEVKMYDGSPPPPEVVIERVCAANQVRAEGHTDSHGGFSFQLGQTIGMVADASTSSGANGAFAGGGFGNTGLSDNSPFGNSQFGSEQQYWDCEIRARLGGYRSDTVQLAGRRPMDNPNIGTLYLYPLSKVDGLTVTATTALAPKDSKKAFEKGVKEAQKGKLDNAEKELRKAVDIYPQHAAAWMELGRVLEGLEKLDEARDAYQHSIDADRQFIPPYEHLYGLEFKAQRWAELAQVTSTLVRLNPYEYPLAYYYNGVAEYQLKNFEAAAKSTREAIEMDRRGQNSKAHMVLGFILVELRDLGGAQASFLNYLEVSPEANDREDIETVLAQIDRVMRQNGITTEVH